MLILDNILILNINANIKNYEDQKYLKTENNY